MSLAAETLPCASCHAPVDPLRAPRVGYFDEHFCYFCSPECAEQYRTGKPAEARPRAPLESSIQPLPSFDNPDWSREPVDLEPSPPAPTPSPPLEPAGSAPLACGRWSET